MAMISSDGTLLSNLWSVILYSKLFKSVVEVNTLNVCQYKPVNVKLSPPNLHDIHIVQSYSYMRHRG